MVEAKDNSQSVGAGMQQALAYADGQALDLPFVFSSNGDGFLFHDKTGTGNAVEQQIDADRLSEAMVAAMLDQPPANALAAT